MPDELYRYTVEFLFHPPTEFDRYRNNRNMNFVKTQYDISYHLTESIINKCNICNTHVSIIKKTHNNGLHHYCFACNPRDIYLAPHVRNLVCNNILECWLCVH